MGGIQCAKTIIDNNRGLSQAIHTQVNVIERQLGCMTNSILLSAGRDVPVFPTEDMEMDFLSATATFQAAVKTAAGPLLEVGARIAAHCDPTKPPGS